MKCKIVFNRNKGKIDTDSIKLVKAPNGNRSLLFDEIKSIYDNDKSALQEYYKVYTDEFQTWFADSPVVDENNEPELMNGSYVNADGEFMNIIPQERPSFSLSQPELNVKPNSVEINVAPFESKIDDNNFTQIQVDILNLFNENTKVLTGNKIEVPVDKLPESKRRIVSKKGDTVTLYEKEKDAQGKDFVTWRVSDQQEKIYLKNLTAAEAQARENAPKSVLSRTVGTEAHDMNENILNEIISSSDTAYTVTSSTPSVVPSKWLIDAEEAFQETDFYKNLLNEVRNGKTFFSHKTKVNMNTGQTYTTREGKIMLDKMVRSMLKIYHQAYAIQNEINVKQSAIEGREINNKPIFLLETPLLDAQADEGGTMDMAVLYSDGTAAIYDHKFIDMKLERRTPAEASLTRDEIYEIRAKQGLSTFKSDNNDWAYFLPDNYQMYRKEESYNMQIARYGEMLTNLYGVKKIRQARILPVSMTYTKIDSGKKNSKGDPIMVYDAEESRVAFILTDEDDYGVSQIPLDIERTDDKNLNTFLDELIKRKKLLTEEMREKRSWNDPKYTDRIRKLDKAIKLILTKKDINYIVESIQTLNDKIQESLSKTGDEEINFEEIVEYLNEIKMYDNFIKSAKREIDELAKTDNDKYQRFKLNLGQAMYDLENSKVETQAKMVSLLERLNTERGFMSDEMFQSYENQRDIGVLGRYMTHLRESNHPLVNMFSKLMDDVNYNVIQERKKLERQILSINEKLTTWGKSRGLSGTKIYDGILTEDKNLIRMFDPKLEVEKDSHSDISESSNIEWYEENFHRSEEDEKRFQDKLKDIKEYYKKNAEDDKDYEARLDSWLKENDIYYKKGKGKAWVTRSGRRYYSPKDPSKWYSKEYTELLKSENKPLFEFYEFYKDQMSKLRSMVDFDIYSNFVPEIRKDTVDTMVQNGMVGIGSFKQQFKNIMNTFKYTDRDEGYQTDDDRKVPIFFTNKVGTENKSVDLAKSLMIFSDFVHNYKGVKDMEHIALSLKELMQNTNGVVKQGIGKAKTETGDFQTTGKNNAQILAMFDDVIGYYIYGEKKKGSVAANKAVDTLTSVSSRKNLAFNFLSAVGGHINAEAQLNMLASKDKYFSSKSLKEARKSAKLGLESLKRSKKNVDDFNSKIMFAADFFEVNQDDMSYEKANKVSLSSMRRKLSQDYAFVLQRYSDDVIDNTALGAMMRDYAIDPINGKAYPISKLQKVYKDHPEYGQIEWKSLWDSTEFEKGKEPKIINQHTNQPIGKNTYVDFRRKSMQLISRIKGNMSAEDIAAYKTTWLGRAIMQYRGWIPATMRERVKGAQYNMTMEDFEVGRWTAAYHMVAKNGAKVGLNFLKQMAPFMESNFNYADTQKMKDLYREFIASNPANDPANPMSDPKDHVSYEDFLNTYVSEAKALAKEFQIYLGLSLGLLLLLMAAGDDEMDNPAVRALVSIVDRAKLEIGFYIPVPFVGGWEETKQLVTRSPVASFSVVEDVVNTLGNTAQETWDVLSGTPWDKTSTPKIGDDSWTLSFKERRDSSPILKHTVSWIPGGKQLTGMLGVFNTTKKDDTIWDYLWGDDYAIYK